MAEKKTGGTLWGGHLHEPPSEDNLAFCSGRDVRAICEADRELLPYDIWGSTAHVLMLQRTGVLTRADARRLLNGLDRILKRFQEGEFEFDPEKEDVHTHIESDLCEICGEEVGGKVHTGRSRNDQAASAMRLYVRDAVLSFHGAVLALTTSLLTLARSHAKTVMPGLTHRQFGTVSSLGHLFTAYAQSLTRDLDRLENAYGRINRSPLGAAAGYGTSWPIDRRLTASYLGFQRLQRNALDAVGSRWESEAELISALAFFANHASQIAADLIFLSSPTVRGILLPDEFVTGSSIMPQKRNPDFAEVILGKAAMVRGYLAGILAIPHGQISGYNREYQWTKYLAFDTFREMRDVPAILSKVVQRIEVDETRLADLSVEGFLNAVDIADFLARERHLTFRQAHHVVARAVGASLEAGAIQLDAINKELRAQKVTKALTAEEFQELADPRQNLQKRRSIGSPQPAEVLATVNHLYVTLREHSSWLKERKKEITDARRRTQQAKRRLRK